MKKVFLAGFILLCSALHLMAQQVESPNGNLVVKVWCNDSGEILYTLSYKNQPVIIESRLGFETEQTDLTNNFKITEVKRDKFTETWKPVWGQYSSIENTYNELDVKAVQNGTGNTLWIEFRVFNDGIGFRYVLPEQSGMNYLTVKEEITEFNQTGDHIAFCIPNDYDTNEFLITTKPLSQIEEDMEAKAPKKGYESKATDGLSIQTPLLLKSASPLYINIHEAALIDYPAMALNVDIKNHKLSAHLVPDKLGKKGYLQLPMNTPWRTIMVSDDARDILASSLIYNVNEPCKIEDTSWVVG